jgi:hypothetical protein
LYNASRSNAAVHLAPFHVQQDTHVLAQEQPRGARSTMHMPQLVLLLNSPSIRQQHIPHQFEPLYLELHYIRLQGRRCWCWSLAVFKTAAPRCK